jgi:hypothetical protein
MWMITLDPSRSREDVFNLKFEPRHKGQGPSLRFHTTERLIALISLGA